MRDEYDLENVYYVRECSMRLFSNKIVKLSSYIVMLLSHTLVRSHNSKQITRKGFYFNSETATI